MTSRGSFIVFEVLDRSGKTTQVRLLVDYLNQIGVKAVEWKFPNRTTPIGEIINSYLQGGVDVDDRVVHLLFSANRWEMLKDLENVLNSGITVVCDRYAYSGIAYSSAKGLDLEWCMVPDRGLIRPDCLFFMGLSADDAMKRGDFGAEIYEKESFQRKVADRFLSLSEPDWKMLDASKSVDKVASEIQREIMAIVQQPKGVIRKYLWLRTEY